MWNLSSILYIYLAGCVLVILLVVLKIVLHWFVGWITKENILNKNLKKIGPPDESTKAHKTLMFLGVLLVEAVLSWINVVVVLFQILKTLLKVIRESLTVVPETIKRLRFPLWNNPNLSRESVWAYCYALGIQSGEIQANGYYVAEALDELNSNYPSFNKVEAVEKLRSLDVVSEGVVESALENLRTDEFET